LRRWPRPGNDCDAQGRTGALDCRIKPVGAARALLRGSAAPRGRRPARQPGRLGPAPSKPRAPAT
ncbi:MAG: hypothetical protein MZU95_04785, partial [Desulfomicrobium escambiense]|nr:hypothetical protein [Desulfomicrobium escambiense]